MRFCLYLFWVMTEARMAFARSKTPSKVVRDPRLCKGMEIPAARLTGTAAALIMNVRIANKVVLGNMANGKNGKEEGRENCSGINRQRLRTEEDAECEERSDEKRGSL
jgi:hypothetical protein